MVEGEELVPTSPRCLGSENTLEDTHKDFYTQAISIFYD
jgi:hypothetical protein